MNFFSERCDRNVLRARIGDRVRERTSGGEVESADFGSRGNPESFGFACVGSVWARAEDAAKSVAGSAASNIRIRIDREFIGLFSRSAKFLSGGSQGFRFGACCGGEVGIS
jgi:hypothetical protein